jgi:uncharacterized protein (DUF2336 family)
MATDKKIRSKSDVKTNPASKHSPEELIEMAVALGVLAGRDDLSAIEREETHNLLEDMSDDAEVRVRAAVSRSISQYPLLPASLAQKLAEDVAEVAGPILENSPVLNDEFLVEQITSADSNDDVQVNIAKRQSLSLSVSDTLLRTGVSAAVETVLSNKSAQIADDSLLALFDRNDFSEEMLAGVAEREDLSAPIVSQCHEIILADHFDREVGKHVRNRLIETYALPEQMASAIVQAALEDALTRTTVDAAAAESELALLAQHLNSHGDLTASLLLRMVCAGSLDFAKAAYHTLTQRSFGEIDIAIFGAGNERLSELYKASGLDPYFRFAVTTAIKTMAEEQNESRTSQSAQAVEAIIREIVSFYRGIAPTTIDQVITSLCHEADRWRQPEVVPAT